MKVTYAFGSFLVMPFFSKKLQIHDALLLTATAATEGIGKQYTEGSRKSCKSQDNLSFSCSLEYTRVPAYCVFNQSQ